jgi:hypothetical protein
MWRAVCFRVNLLYVYDILIPIFVSFAVNFLFCALQQSPKDKHSGILIKKQARKKNFHFGVEIF